MSRIFSVLFSVVVVLSMVTGGVVGTSQPGADGVGDTVERADSNSANTPLSRLLSAVRAATDDGNSPPQVTFSVQPASPAPGESTIFEASDTYDTDGEVVAYEWSVDGERVAGQASAEYVFETTGTREVRLTVTDDDGGTASLTKLVTVGAEVGDGQDRITAVSEPEPTDGFETEKPDRDNEIPFLAGSTVLEEGLDPAVTDTDREVVWAVVQFYRSPSAEEIDTLSGLGYRERSPVADDAYYAGIPRENLEAVADVESVRSVAAIDPEWKLLPALADRLREADDGQRFRVNVRAFDPIPQRADELELRQVGERTYRGSLTAETIRQLRDNQVVEWIEPHVEPTTSIAEGRRMVAAQRVALPSADGTGVRVGVVDTGIDHDHPYFSGVRVLDSFDEVDGDTFPEADDFGENVFDTNGHGTHVAGTIAGSAIVNGRAHVGIATNATLVIARGFGVDQFSRVNNQGTDIISNSWGASVGGQYTTRTAAADRWARQNPQTLVVVAYGNYNASNPAEQFADDPGLAKNVLTVGSINDGSKEIGNPAFKSTVDTVNNVAWLNNKTQPVDGRTKPDVNAPGAWITSAVPNGTYATFVGSSMATPHVSGIAALYEDEYSGFDPDANSIKAAIVAATGPVENPKPSERPEGHGGVNAFNTLYNNSYESRSINYGGSLKPPFPTTNSHHFDVAGDAEKVVVSLSWLDPPGSPGSLDTTVNDLDLYVGPTSDPKRYSVTDRDGTLDRIAIENLSPGERGTQWVVTVDPHDMWTGIGRQKPRQDYDGRIRVVTEEPTLSVSAPDRIVVEPQAAATTAFETEVEATGAPVHGIRATIDSDSWLGDCSGFQAHAPAYVIGARSADYLSKWSQRLCYDVPDDAGTYPVNVTVNYTTAAGQVGTLETQTDIVVPRPRVKLEPFERQVGVGEQTGYELVVENVSNGVGAYEVNVSLDQPPIGEIDTLDVQGGATSDSVTVDPDNEWVIASGDGMDTDDYGNTSIGRLRATGESPGITPISVEVTKLENEFGTGYQLRPQGSGLGSAVPTDGLLNVTQGSTGIDVSIPGGGDGSSIVVGDSLTFEINVSVIDTEFDADVQEVSWEFGDGNSASGRAVDHSYAEPGEYTVRAEVALSNGQTETLSRQVEVATDDGAGAVELTADGASSVEPGGTVSVTFSLRNLADTEATGGLQLSVPAELSVTDVTGAGTNQPTRFFADPIAPGETVTVTYTFAVSEAAAFEPISVGASGSLQIDGETRSDSTTVEIDVVEDAGLPTAPGEASFQDVLAVIEAFNDDRPYSGVEVSFQDVLVVIEAFNDG